MVLYAALRFPLSYMRMDEQDLFRAPVPQFTSALILGIAVITAGILYRHPGPITPEYAERVWGDLEPPDEESPPPTGKAAARA